MCACVWCVYYICSTCGRMWECGMIYTIVAPPSYENTNMVVTFHHRGKIFKVQQSRPKHRDRSRPPVFL